MREEGDPDDATPDNQNAALASLEIAYMVTNSRTVWLFTFDKLLLGLGLGSASFLT